MTDEPIPENVLDALEEVRTEGLTNMLASRMVIFLMADYDPDAAIWLREHPNRYMEALTAIDRNEKGAS
ncbi:MAG TPA: hypothetical protein DCP69_04395 [Candidatus Omnitrophica bacterium]|nr:hypothetical protein [Candidatus Omnitrophota bacterium]